MHRIISSLFSAGLYPEEADSATLPVEEEDCAAFAEDDDQSMPPETSLSSTYTHNRPGFASIDKSSALPSKRALLKPCHLSNEGLLQAQTVDIFLQDLLLI